MVEDYCVDLEVGKYVVNVLVFELNIKMFVDWVLYLGYDYIDVWDIICFEDCLKEFGWKMCEFFEGFVM